MPLLPEALVQSYVNGFQNAFSHLITTLGDLIEHIKHPGTCTITWENYPHQFYTDLEIFNLPTIFSLTPKCQTTLIMNWLVDFVEF